MISWGQAGTVNQGKPGKSRKPDVTGVTGLPTDTTPCRRTRRVLTDAQWATIESMVPSSQGRRGKPLRDSRQVIDGIIYRYRTGVAWRDLPADFGPWQTVWKRHRRYALEGLWDRVLTALVAEADAAGHVDWTVSVDSTIVRAHQHATNTTRLTGGSVELQEFGQRAS